MGAFRARRRCGCKEPAAAQDEGKAKSQAQKASPTEARPNWGSYLGSTGRGLAAAESLVQHGVQRMQRVVRQSYTCHYHPGLFYALTSRKQLFGVGTDSCERQDREIFTSHQIDWAASKDFPNVKGIAYQYGLRWMLNFLHGVFSKPESSSLGA